MCYFALLPLPVIAEITVPVRPLRSMLRPMIQAEQTPPQAHQNSSGRDRAGKESVGTPLKNAAIGMKT